MLATLLFTLTLSLDTLGSAEAVRHYQYLLASAKWGMGDQERAAFLVRDSDGTLTLLEWTSHDSFRASWRGVMPAGTIAVVHTHPHFDPEPSRHDITEAQRIGIPIVVLSRHGMTAVDASGAIYDLHAGRKP